MPRGTAALLERDRDVETLAEQLRQAGDGSGGLTVVEGPAGIGKTALLEHAQDLAEAQGLAVLRARGGALERQVPYGVMRQLLERPLVRADEVTRAALLSGPAGAAASVLDLAAPPQDAGFVHDPGPAIRHGLHWLLANLAEQQPLLVVVDDAHWSDLPSLAAIDHIARRLDGLAIALVVGRRDDLPPDERRALDDLVGGMRPVAVRPAPLGPAAVGAVVGRAFGGAAVPAPLASACLHATGGNPFYATELAAELAAAHAAPADVAIDQVQHATPVAVRRSLMVRLAGLGADAEHLARALAVLGGEGELRHAARVADLPADRAAVAADALVAGGLLAPGRPPRIVHPLVRAAIVEQIPGSERTAAHRSALEALRGDDRGDAAVVVHALESEPGGDPDLVALLRRTADQALRNGAPEVAAAHLERALAEPPPPLLRPVVLADLGRAEVRRGAFGDGLARLDHALELLDDPPARAAVHRDRAFAAFASAGMHAAREIVDRAVSELDAARAGQDALQLEADLALLAWLSGADHGLDLRRHHGLAGETRAERTLLALLAQEEQATGGRPGTVVELCTRALGGGRLVDEDGSEALSWYMATYALLICEAHAEARATIAHALDDARRRGSAFAGAGALGTRAVLALGEGRPREAEADARAAAGGPIPPIMVPVNAAYVVLALVDQGDLDAAADELRAGGLEHGPGGPTVLRWIPWARARLNEARGDAGAVAVDVVALEEDDRAGRPMRSLAWRALLARSCAGGPPGEAALARTLAREHLSWATGWGLPGALGVAQRAAALTSPSSEERLERLEEAVATLARSDLATEEARARRELGVGLLRAGRSRQGRDQLEAALEIAVACGAQSTGRGAADELAVAGAPRHRLRFDELTASERRVAELAATGRSNREIAEELFVTPKTVENHLTRIYAKLGIGSREALADVL